MGGTEAGMLHAPLLSFAPGTLPVLEKRANELNYTDFSLLTAEFTPRDPDIS